MYKQNKIQKIFGSIKKPNLHATMHEQVSFIPCSHEQEIISDILIKLEKNFWNSVYQWPFSMNTPDPRKCIMNQTS